MCVCLDSAEVACPSVEVSVDWEVVSEIEFSQLGKLNYSPEEPEEL